MNLEIPSSPEKGRERISASALRFQGEVYTGRTHGDAMITMEESFPFWHEEKEVPEDGFVTSTGRFVNRDEAGEIAKKASQLDHLSSPRKENAAEYLDTNDLKNYG